MQVMENENKTNIVDFRTSRKKTKKWSPEKKFTEFGKIRVPKLLRAMKSVKNLATVYNSKTEIGYKYTDKQKTQLLKEIKKGWKELKYAWENSITIEEELKGKKIIKAKKKPEWDWDTE
jgi:predicted RNA-binding protein with EMAP domain